MKRPLFIFMLLLSVLSLHAQQRSYRNILQTTDSSFFATAEARRIGDQLLLYQRVTGGWPKNIDMVKPLTDEERQTATASPAAMGTAMSTRFCTRRLPTGKCTEMPEPN